MILEVLKCRRDEEIFVRCLLHFHFLSSLIFLALLREPSRASNYLKVKCSACVHCTTLCSWVSFPEELEVFLVVVVRVRGGDNKGHEKGGATGLAESPKRGM